MAIHIDIERGKKAAEMLYSAWQSTGIHGRKDMPEDYLPEGMMRGLLEHILFITLTASIDYQRDADALWASARRTYEDLETRYLFKPEALKDTPSKKIISDMQKYGLSKKPEKDAWIWRTVGISFAKKWKGDPRLFLQEYGWNAPEILEGLRCNSHMNNGKNERDFPYLRGAKIGPLWLRMLRDNARVTEFQNPERVPIPVDRHVARATLALGVVRGQHTGQLEDIFELIRETWFEAMNGLYVGSRPMIALDLDEALWQLSRYGCTKRDRETGKCPVIGTCELGELCVPGKIVIDAEKVEVDT